VITKAEAIQKFKDLLLVKPTWRTLSKSQFVSHLAVFMSWALREALWKIERTFQEFFLSTALNEPSVLAHVEDREYIPRKRTPSSGSGMITNNGTSIVYLPIYQPFSSDADIDYVTDRALTLSPGAASAVEFVQVAREEIIHSVTEEKPFYEILFDKAKADQIHDFKVMVDIGYGYEDWVYSRLFQNAYEGDHVYDEFYTHGGRTGIRFGNDYIGTVLPVGTSVKIELWLTNGETYLAEGQSLYPVGEILDSLGQATDLSAVTTEAIADGQAKEAVAEMRQNLQYWTIYNEKLVWRDDYIFFIQRAVANILWIRVWGEAEAEAIHGPRFEFINKIFVSAYAEDRPGLETEIMDQLSQVHILNRKFEWADPIFSTFHLDITGKISRTGVISDVQAAIIEALTENYGKDSPDRLSEVLVKDFYRIINGTGHFSATGAYFEVSHTGTIEPTELNEMVHIDMVATTITLSYL
jgi:hypothetical protein